MDPQQSNLPKSNDYIRNYRIMRRIVFLRKCVIVVIIKSYIALTILNQFNVWNNTDFVKLIVSSL